VNEALQLSVSEDKYYDDSDPLGGAPQFLKTVITGIVAACNGNLGLIVKPGV
jgi:hypothetical protein